MPGFVVHVGAQVQCAHFGTATPMVPNPRVNVSGQPTVTMASPYMVAGCTLPSPPAANGPCLSAIWTRTALRVFSNGQPLVLQDSLALCAPSGTPLRILFTQIRVTGA